MKDEEDIKHFIQESITKWEEYITNDLYVSTELFGYALEKAMIKKYNLDYTNRKDRILINQTILAVVQGCKKIIKKRLKSQYIAL